MRHIFARWQRRLASTRDLYAGRLAIAHATLEATVFRADGRIERLGVIARKKVTGEFVTFIVANMVTDTTEIGDFKFHDSGTGVAAEANTDGDLGTPAGPTTRATGTQVQGGTAAAPTYTSVGTIAYTGTLAITEHGVFTTAARTSTVLMDRSVFAAINVVSGDSIQFTYVLTINAEA